MSQKNPSYVVTDLEDSDEEELVKNLLAAALNQSPKISRGTSTIKEWMAIIEGTQNLKQLLALTSPQRQALETYASNNPDMELDTDHIMCMYSMIRKSKPLDLASAPTGLPKPLTKSNLAHKQHSQILQQSEQPPSSPTPSEQQQSSFRVDSISQRIIDSSSRLLDTDTDDIPFRPQSKGKKVSIDPSLANHTTTNNDNDDDTSRHNSSNDNSATRLKKGDGQPVWKNPSMNIDDSKIDDITKSRMSSIFDATEDGYSGNNGYRSPNVTHERLFSRQQNSKLSFPPLDGNWESQNLNNNSTRQQDQQDQRADQNVLLLDALIKEMETEMGTLRQKVTEYETQDARQKEEIEQLSGHIEKLNSQAANVDEKYKGSCDKLSDEINKLQEKLKQNQVELDSTRNALLANKHKCVELQQESMYWKTTVEKRDDAYDTLLKNFEHQKGLHEKLELEMYMKDDELKKSTSRVEELEKTIPQNMTAQKVQETLAMVAQLQKEKQACDTIINNTVNELASMTKGYEGLQQKVKELERQRDQQLRDMSHTSGPSSLWYQRESINQDKKRLSSVCKQLDSQASVIEQLRLQILTSGSKFNQGAMKKKSPCRLLLGVLGLCLVLVLSATIYAINNPPVAYGLWNDPNGYQGQWIPNAPPARSPILLLLDRLLLPKDYSFTPPM